MSITASSLRWPGPAGSTKHRPWVLPAVFLGMAVALFAAGFVLGHFGMPGEGYVTPKIPPEHARQFHIFWEAWQEIEQQFYSPTPLEPQAMTHGAIRGMVAALNDPYTSFVEPPEQRLESDTFQGDFGGIGASLVLRDSQPTAVEVYGDSPAQVAGLQVGDRLLAVDGIQVAALPLDQVVLLIRGRVGTPVQVDVQRVGGQTVSLSIVRQLVEVPSLTWQMLLDGIGYVRIHLFSARTGEELARAIQELRRQGASALVLDLRGNGGGLTGGAIDVLRRLLGHGIAFRELKRDAEEQRHAIPFGEPLADWPLAVLVDGGTASAAEMVAAAIRDYERGAIIGQRTFGKGSVQGVFQLSDGSSVHITTSHWQSPNGYPVQGVGLQPDISVKLTGDSAVEDLFLRQAAGYLEQRLGRAITESIGPLQTYRFGKVMV